jgi:hypothetical protein
MERRDVTQLVCKATSAKKKASRERFLCLAIYPSLLPDTSRLLINIYKCYSFMFKTASLIAILFPPTILEVLKSKKAGIKAGNADGKRPLGKGKEETFIGDAKTQKPPPSQSE